MANYYESRHWSELKVLVQIFLQFSINLILLVIFSLLVSLCYPLGLQTNTTGHIHLGWSMVQFFITNQRNIKFSKNMVIFVLSYSFFFPSRSVDYNEITSITYPNMKPFFGNDSQLLHL